MNARCNFGPLLEANALEVLAPELPDPRPEHEEQRPHHGTGAAERVRRTDVIEERDSADHHQDDHRDWELASTPNRAAANEEEAEAGGDQARAEDGGAR